jgi:hypothetical protein
MANDITLGEIKALALDQADMTGSDFIDDARLTYWVNSALSELHDLLVDAYEDFHVATYEIALTAGTSTYALPTDFYKLLKLFHLESGSGTRTRLRRFNLDEYGALGDPFVHPASVDSGMLYRILGTNIELVPDPTGNGTLELWYAPAFTKLRNDSDLIHLTVPVMWEDFVVCDVAARCLEKEESDSRPMLLRKAEAKQRIIASSQNRDAGMPERVIDVYRDEDSWDY